MDSVLVSVIIPAYNVEKYIGACIDSVISQTYKNIEIIVVDDGSTDTTGAICDAKAAQDARVVVVHQKNQGLSAARNNGTVICKGAYIAFVDGDDIVSEEYLEEMWNISENGSYGLIECEYGEIIDGTKRLHGDQKSLWKGKASEYLLSDEFLTMACCKLIRTELAKKYPFPIGKIHEDVAVMPRMVYEAGQVAYTQKSLYFYNARPDSINTKERYYLKHLDMLEFIKDNITYFYSINENAIARKMERQYIYALLDQYGKVKKHFPDRKNILKDIKKNLQVQVKKSMTDSEIKGKTRALLFVSSYIPELWLALTNE